jgi:hypothetical protein
LVKTKNYQEQYSTKEEGLFLNLMNGEQQEILLWLFLAAWPCEAQGHRAIRYNLFAYVALA